MSENNSPKEEKQDQEEQKTNQNEPNEIKNPQEEDAKDAMLEQEENKKIFVKNIPFKTTDSQLSDFFSRFGKVEKSEIIKRDNGYSSGVGFVEFSTVEEKKNVLMANRDDLVIEGRRLDVKEARVDKMDYSKTLYVGNLSFDTNEETLKKFFMDFCQNLKGDFKVSIQRAFGGKPKGHAYIEFENEEDISNALKANGERLDDRNLVVEMKRTRGPEGLRGRGRGRYQGGMWRRGGFGNEIEDTTMGEREKIIIEIEAEEEEARAMIEVEKEVEIGKETEIEEETEEIEEEKEGIEAIEIGKEIEGIEKGIDIGTKKEN